MSSRRTSPWICSFVLISGCSTARAQDPGSREARDAYRFARGAEITASSGRPLELSRALDFLVVADHSDDTGFFTPE